MVVNNYLELRAITYTIWTRSWCYEAFGVVPAGREEQGWMYITIKNDSAAVIMCGPKGVSGGKE